MSDFVSGLSAELAKLAFVHSRIDLLSRSWGRHRRAVARTFKSEVNARSYWDSEPHRRVRCGSLRAFCCSPPNEELQAVLTIPEFRPLIVSRNARTRWRSAVWSAGSSFNALRHSAAASGHAEFCKHGPDFANRLRGHCHGDLLTFSADNSGLWLLSLFAGLAGCFARDE